MRTPFFQNSDPRKLPPACSVVPVNFAIHSLLYRAGCEAYTSFNEIHHFIYCWVLFRPVNFVSLKCARTACCIPGVDRFTPVAHRWLWITTQSNATGA